MTAVSQIVAKHTVAKGGNVILYQLENEYVSSTLTIYWPTLT